MEKFLELHSNVKFQMRILSSSEPVKLTDEIINALYPIKMRKLSDTHWTPVDIALKAVKFLAEGGRKTVLDLGSGSGKFCLVAALTSEATVVGVEKRENLVQLSRKISKNLELENLSFIQSDLIDIDFTIYDSFYFFNAFEELINSKDQLDKHQELDQGAHNNYILSIREKFDETPVKTRIVTYCGECEEIPDSFRLVKVGNKGKLRFWEKRA